MSDAIAKPSDDPSASAAQAETKSTASAQTNVIDLTGDKESPEVGNRIDASNAAPPVGQTDPYNPDRARDGTRQTITLWLIGLLCSIVALSFVALFASGAATGFAGLAFFDNFKKILDVILPPVTTLLASTVGFYFGYKQSELINAVKNPGLGKQT